MLPPLYKPTGGNDWRDDWTRSQVAMLIVNVHDSGDWKSRAGARCGVRTARGRKPQGRQETHSSTTVHVRLHFIFCRLLSLELIPLRNMFSK